MSHKRALVHRKCGMRLADGTKCVVTWSEHPRKEGKVWHGDG
jgi:hypothetical protein